MSLFSAMTDDGSVWSKGSSLFNISRYMSTQSRAQLGSNWLQETAPKPESYSSPWRWMPFLDIARLTDEL